MPGPASFPAFGSMGKILSNPAVTTGMNAVVPGSGVVAGLAGALLNSGGSNGNSGGSGNMLNTDVGGGTMLGIGALKNLQANRQQKQANAMFPATEDPEMRMLANDYRRRRRAFMTGTANYAEMANQRAMAKQGINAAFNAGGGATGLNRMQQILGQAMLGGKQAGMQGEMFYTQQYGDTINKLAQTRLEKALLRYNTAQAKAAQTKTDANRMTYGGLARVLGTGNPYSPNTGGVPSINVNTQEETQDESQA